ncbi:amino acid permease [Plantibacter sp. RU18]|uniref:amino acid permease n=1 Tax=Plantibacter sp. RU18 TaxID=3158143 RepID=UPI003D35B81D
MTQSSADPSQGSPSSDPSSDFSAEEQGYHHSLSSRQIQMIALGGAIGTGLFLGAGGRLASAGPALMLVYAVCGLFAFFILRALGELVLHRPSSGSFISYAREFYGEKLAFGAGWLYFMNWAMVAIVDVTAIAIYLKTFGRLMDWPELEQFPQWIFALIALVVVIALNLVSVKVFGEMEFWLALVKVAALVIFLVFGICFIVFGGRTDLGETGFSLIADAGGLFPLGAFAPLVAISGVVFAYAAIELVGIAAGETAEPRRSIPKAVNAVIFRIAIFYVGSVLLLSLLLPYSAYEAGVSPFVTFFSHIGSPEAGSVAASVMNLVVLTAALSGLNAGLYSTGRILRSMAANGSAPRSMARMSRSGVPYGGILLAGAITLLGVVLNAVAPSKAFEVVLEMSALGVVGGWATIVLCQIALQRRAKLGLLERPAFRMPGAPFTAYLTLAFLAFVLVSLSFSETGRWVLASIVIIVPALVIEWHAARPGIAAAAAARVGYTGSFPVVAERPAHEAARPEEPRPES